MTSYSKKFYTYTIIKDRIVQKMQKAFGYEVEISLKDIEEYDTEGERTTRISSLDNNPNKKETNKIGLDTIYQS